MEQIQILRKKGVPVIIIIPTDQNPGRQKLQQVFKINLQYSSSFINLKLKFNCVKTLRFKGINKITKVKHLGLFIGHGKVFSAEELVETAKEYEERKTRVKTAPEKSQHKNWVVGSVEIKTARGVKMKVRPPGKVRIVKVSSGTPK